MTNAEPAPTVYDHLRTDGDGQYEAGVYRVVGVTDDRITLLRVTDGRGRRRSTGTVTTVSYDEATSAFEPARNPDTGFDPTSAVRTAFDAIYWTVRSKTGL